MGLIILNLLVSGNSGAEKDLYHPFKISLVFEVCFAENTELVNKVMLYLEHSVLLIEPGAFGDGIS